MLSPYPYVSTYAVSTAAAAVTTTLAATPGIRRGIAAVTVSCSGAASGAITLTIADGSTTVFEVDLTLALEVPQQPLPFPIMGSLGNAVAVTASAGASSCVVKLNVLGFDFDPSDTPPE